MVIERRIETEGELLGAVRVGQTCEDESLEFKEAVKAAAQQVRWEKQPARELARDIAGLANSFGGCLVVGVAEGALSSGGYRRATAIVGVEGSETARKFLDQAVRNHLAPSDLDYDVRIISRTHGDPVVAVNVPAFERGIVSVWNSGQKRYVEYPYRTSFGKEYLTPHLVEERLMDRTRAIEIRTHRLFKKYGTARNSVRLLSPIVVNHKQSRVDTFEVHIHQLRANEIDLMVTGHGSGPRKKSEKIAVPFGIVEEIWDTDAQIGLLLRLSLVLFHDPLMQAIFSPLPG